MNYRNLLINAWLVAGTLDLTAAMIQTLLKNGSIIKLLQYIASGVFGAAAFSGGTLYAVYGTLFHYIIALGWSVLLFAIYPRLPKALKQPITLGIVYGLFVWFMMNRIVLPLSNIQPRPFVWAQAIIAALVLIVAIGLPLAFFAKKYYSTQGGS